MAKTTIVRLTCTSLGSRDFEISHAERLLNMPNNGGWQLPKDSEYELKDGIISRRNKKGSRASDGQQG
jgi:hypothetical protein